MTTTPDQHAAQPAAPDPSGTGAAVPAQTPGDAAASGASDAPDGPDPADPVTVLEQAAPAPPPRTPTPRDLPRWVRWTVVPLLVLVPIGYVLISAEQSRDSGQNKQQEAAVTHLSRDLPSTLQQRIYQVPFPTGVTGPGYLETNSWDTSQLYVQFTTTAGGLDTFLAQVGTSRYALRPGRGAITAGQGRAAGWVFPPGHDLAGAALHQVGDKPDHDIVVDLSSPDAPTVYVVSTVNFQHGFGGG